MWLAHNWGNTQPITVSPPKLNRHQSMEEVRALGGVCLLHHIFVVAMLFLGLCLEINSHQLGYQLGLYYSTKTIRRRIKQQEITVPHTSHKRRISMTGPHFPMTICSVGERLLMDNDINYYMDFRTI